MCLDYQINLGSNNAIFYCKPIQLIWSAFSYSGVVSLNRMLWTGASNARGVWKNRDFCLLASISLYLRNGYKTELYSQWLINSGVSNSAISNDLEQSQTQISRSCHYITPSMSEMVRN